MIKKTLYNNVIPETGEPAYSERPCSELDSSKPVKEMPKISIDTEKNVVHKADDWVSGKKEYDIKEVYIGETEEIPKYISAHMNEPLKGKKYIRLSNRNFVSVDEMMSVKEEVIEKNKRIEKLLKECQILLFNNGFLFNKPDRQKAINLICKITNELGE